MVTYVMFVIFMIQSHSLSQFDNCEHEALYCEHINNQLLVRVTKVLETIRIIPAKILFDLSFFFCRIFTLMFAHCCDELYYFLKLLLGVVQLFAVPVMYFKVV